MREGDSNDGKIQEWLDAKTSPKAWEISAPEADEVFSYQTLEKRLRRRKMPPLPSSLAANVRKAVRESPAGVSLPRQWARGQVLRLGTAVAVLLLAVCSWLMTDVKPKETVLDPHQSRVSNSPAEQDVNTPDPQSLQRFLSAISKEVWREWPGGYPLPDFLKDEGQSPWHCWGVWQRQPEPRQNSVDIVKEYLDETFSKIHDFVQNHTSSTSSHNERYRG